MGGPYYRYDLEQAQHDYIMGKLNEGTRDIYTTAWKHWRLFCRARGRDPPETLSVVIIVVVVVVAFVVVALVVVALVVQLTNVY